MRQITIKAGNYFLNGMQGRYRRTLDNTEIRLNREYVSGVQIDGRWVPGYHHGEISMSLFGNKIAWRKHRNDLENPEDLNIYWTMAGFDTVTTRERLSGIGVNLVRKRGKTFWHKPGGEIVEVNPNVVYNIHYLQAVKPLMASGNMYIAQSRLDKMVPNRQRFNPALLCTAN